MECRARADMPEILSSDVRLDHITLLRLGMVSGVSRVHWTTDQIKMARSYVKNVYDHCTEPSLFLGRGGGK
jgi:hypothetical protein